MRASTAYFAGAGTVIVAIVAGVGGGLLFADMVSPKTPKQEMTRLEQRMSAQPIQVKAEPTTAAAPTVPAPPAETEAKTTAPASASPPAVTPPTDTVAASQTTAPVAQPAASPAQPVAQKQADVPSSQPSAQKQSEEPPIQPPAQKQAAASPEDAQAKAKDVDIKRAASEKRRSERRQQWSEKRRYQRREDPDQELREVEAKVREETETKPFFGSEPVRSEGRRIRIIDLD